MTDFGVQPPAPQIEAPLSAGLDALDPVVPDAPQQPFPTSLITSPVPVVPEQVSNVEQAIPADWHPNDPVKRGVMAGHVDDYAVQQPGGLADAKQHWGTFAKLADSGLIPETGDTKETMRLWRKFQSNPEQLKPEESAALSTAVGQIGQATSKSPDLQFDPVGKVASVGARGEVRVSYPSKANVGDLSLKPLAPSAMDRLRTLVTLGKDATHDVPLQDVLPAFLGLDTHERPKDLSILEEAVNGLANEMGADPGQIRAAIAAGWQSMKVPTEPWARPFGFRAGGVNPAEDAVADGLSQNVISAMQGGVSSLDFTTEGDPAISVQPEGGLAVSAPPTERNARLLRHLYPAFSKGGVTAWLPGEPAKTEDASKLSAVYSTQFLTAFGGHPLFKPGEHIVYDATSPNQAGQDLGPVLSTGPALQQRRLKASEIDPNNLPNLLESHQWALIPAGNSTRAGLIRSGFNPIPHRIGGSDGLLVFGISPDQARSHASGEIVANDGTYSADGFRAGDGLSFDNPDDGQRSVTRLLTGDVHWFLSGVDRSSDPTDPPGEETTTQRARRRALTVTGDLQTAVAELERQGAKNLQVYAHRNQLDGFKTAWEHVYSDGVNVGSVVTKKPAQEAHTGPVLVRSTDGLPDSHNAPQTARTGSTGLYLNGVPVITTEVVDKLTSLKAKYLKLDGDAIVPADDAGDAQIVGKRIVVNDPTPAAARLVQMAKATGLPDSSFNVMAPGQFRTDPVASMVTLSGARVHPIKQTRPSEAWADRFGIVFDPAWRTQDGVQELDPSVTKHLANVYEAFLGQFRQAAEMWGLDRLAVTSSYSQSPAYTEWGQLGGAIGLSAKHWQDPALLTDHVIRLQSNGTIVSNVMPTPGYFVTHELGHIVHGALQFGTDSTGAKRQLLQLRKAAGREGIVRGLSNQAWTSPEEMVAEAVVESVLASNPRPMAREIVNIVNAAYSKVGKARGKANW